LAVEYLPFTYALRVRGSFLFDNSMLKIAAIAKIVTLNTCSERLGARREKRSSKSLLKYESFQSQFSVAATRFTSAALWVDGSAVFIPK
jgi:hypothetical protein